MTGLPAALVALATLVVSVLAGWFVVAGILALAARSQDSGGSTRGGPGEQSAGGDPDVDAPAAQRPGQGVLRGGTWIGLLERLAVTGTVLLGHPEGVAVVVAVKGLGRYPEIARNPEVSERFVIGSLASLVWAAALGAAGRALLG
ncbi:hypothetical protein Q6348_11305 [Isoptericola sp. b441]|uniref:MAPEG family protein n=1 Tax=Actinotalea lenta TaxID=3064654 RepID=A0ABT9DBV2_9CELL|nr:MULTISPECIES: hypothetical protein [unclassified Isoptericola]MDO8107784.1 hypothetical protein [Isoptericola sp. b441]MDO8120545.1 hypothetical protein [Isoptericola sp. b490]